MRHFREPIPIQTTAMEQVSTVMGADENVIEALDTICTKSSPTLIALLTTGLSETQGSDIVRLIAEFRQQHPEHQQTIVVPVATPDYTSSLEGGFATATKAVLKALVPEAVTTPIKSDPQRVNLIVSSALTPGDLEELIEIVEWFGLTPVVIPDLSDSLDGHLHETDFSPLSLGGSQLDLIRSAARATATLVIGASQYGSGELLHTRTGVPSYPFPHLMGLEQMDQLMMTLNEISGNPVPKRLERQRAQLQDAMLDSHFMLGMARVAIAAEPDLLAGYCQLLSEIGSEVVTAVSPINTPYLTQIPLDEIKIGDLEDLEQRASQKQAQLLICNAHGVEAAKRLNIPLIRAGFPQYDALGLYRKRSVGYRGCRDLLFEMANQLQQSAHIEISPYRSIYKQEFTDHGITTAA